MRVSLRPVSPASTITLVASGDLRQSANEQCWSGQAAMEARLVDAIERSGRRVTRGHAFDRKRGHGFIASQREGLDVFAQIAPDAPLIVAEAVWQYSHHVLPGLVHHRGPILTVANWSGTWPGLVGMLNLNGSLTKAGGVYSTLWSEDFADEFFLRGLQEWLDTGKVTHARDHVTPWHDVRPPARAAKLGTRLASELRQRRAILGVFDEGCMGMYNAIIPDELLMPLGVFKERLSQSALYYATTQVTETEARTVFEWFQRKGLRFHFGSDPATDLTEEQVLWQCRMYVASCRLTDEFGCDAIGIQYQQGLKDLLPASDLVEGTLNNSDRPPVKNAAGRIIHKGEPIPHFNEVDECAGLDALMTHRVHRALDQPPETTLHDLRWGDVDRSGTVPDYVWVFLISGAAPPAHHIGGWRGSESLRQPPVYFRLGGGSLRGIAKPGDIVWSRIYVAAGKLKMDLGRATVVKLPDSETQRRWSETTPAWPIMHAVLHGVTRDQMMAQHQSNHIQVAYANTAKEADEAMYAKAAMAAAMGLEVNLCGTKANGRAF